MDDDLPSVMIVQIVAIALFFLIGSALMQILIDYIKSKPPIFVTLIDLINIDTLTLENFNKGVYCVIHIVIATKYQSYWLATSLSFLLSFSAMIFLTYLSFGAAIQYVLVKWKRTCLFENMDEYHLIRFIRLVLPMIAGFTLLTLGFLNGPERSYILHSRMMGREPKGLVVGVAILFGLSALALIINLYSRFLLYNERRSAARLGMAGSTKYVSGSLLPYVTKIFVGILFTLLFRIILPTHLVGIVNIAVYVGFSNFLFIVVDAKTARFFCKTIFAWYECLKMKVKI